MINNDAIPDLYLGIQYGDFDGKIKASSSYDVNHDVRGCKLNCIMPKKSSMPKESNEKGETPESKESKEPKELIETFHSSAWVAARYDKNPWIQVNLGKTLLISGVSIQGRHDMNQYVTKFRVLYSNDGEKFWNISEFEGNSDNKTVVKRSFPYPVYATYIRIQILECYAEPSLRFDLHYIPNEIPDLIKNKILSKFV